MTTATLGRRKLAGLLAGAAATAVIAVAAIIGPPEGDSPVGEPGSQAGPGLALDVGAVCRRIDGQRFVVESHVTCEVQKESGETEYVTPDYAQACEDEYGVVGMTAREVSAPNADVTVFCYGPA